jgi:hypothetical protein
MKKLIVMDLVWIWSDLTSRTSDEKRECMGYDSLWRPHSDVATAIDCEILGAGGRHPTRLTGTWTSRVIRRGQKINRAYWRLYETRGVDRQVDPALNTALYVAVWCWQINICLKEKVGSWDKLVTLAPNLSHSGMSTQKWQLPVYGAADSPSSIC